MLFDELTPEILLLCNFFYRLYGDVGINFASHMLVCAPMAASAIFLTWILLTFVYAPEFVAQLWRRRKESADQITVQEKLAKSLALQYGKLGTVRCGIKKIFYVLNNVRTLSKAQNGHAIENIIRSFYSKKDDEAKGRSH